jgi:hypothetical protein
MDTTELLGQLPRMMMHSIPLLGAWLKNQACDGGGLVG